MDQEFFKLILAVKRKCQGKEEEICRSLGLSQAEFHALLVLDGRQEMLGGEFSERMGLSPSRGSRVLTRLMSSGLATARLGEEDRRTVHIAPTEKGRQARSRIARQMRACEERICSHLSEAEQGQVRGALERLAAIL
jgi:DNA-binding MarR family transcriptional regulator